MTIGSNTRRVWSDPAERVCLSHVLEAAHLLLMGHAPSYVERGRGRAVFVYARAVAPILKRLREATNEMSALAARQQQRSSPETRDGGGR